MTDVLRGSVDRRERAARIGLVLAIAALAAPATLIVIAQTAAHLFGAAVDPYDGNILNPKERADLDGIVILIWMVVAGGTALGIPAFIIGIVTADRYKHSWATIVVAAIAAFVTAFMTLSLLLASASPDYIEGTPDLTSWGRTFMVVDGTANASGSVRPLGAA